MTLGEADNEKARSVAEARKEALKQAKDTLKTLKDDVDRGRKFEPGTISDLEDAIDRFENS